MLTGITPTIAASAPKERVFLTASLSDRVVNDSVGRNGLAKAIPGSVVEYAVTITNASAGSPDPDSVIVANPVPQGMQMVVADLPEPGSGPVAFVDGPNLSGLIFRFQSLASLTDMLEFSANDGASFDYLPVSGPQGTDPNVTNFRMRLSGRMAAGAPAPSSFTVRYRMRIN